MAGVNKVILLGNVGTDPEVRHLEGGASVANFRLATTESFKDRNGQRIDQTEWHNIVAWRGLAEVVEKLVRKGNQIYLEGKLRTRIWEDKDGNKRQTTEIVAETINLVGQRREDQNPNSGFNPSSFSDPTTGNGY